ncbi:MAG TPA: hypothetical protein VF829_02360 [Candidatus Paceibacterota bacterium]
MATDAKKDWEAYVAREQERVTPLLAARSFTLDAEQPQTIGERYLTRPIGSGRKVVLFGRRRSNGMRVVVKTSSETQGKDELLHETRVHAMLSRIRFAYGTFALPEILLFDKQHGVLVTEYIEQEKSFLERPLKEQFALALDAFKAQESTHATTAEHWSELERLMKEHAHYVKPGEYRKIGEYAQDLVGLLADEKELYSKIDALLNKVIELLEARRETLERYDGFLTHWDFTPQNFRIRDDTLYLLDLTSIRFGNKYESWARFINFMTLYNSPLAQALVEYVQLNRTEEEVNALRLMRAYRLVELIRYYATWLGKTQGDTLELAKARIAFWTEVLEAVLNGREVSEDVIDVYKNKRDALRTADEKQRQRGLH